MATKTKRPNASGKMNRQAANVSFCLLVKAGDLRGSIHFIVSGSE